MDTTISIEIQSDMSMRDKFETSMIKILVRALTCMVFNVKISKHPII